MRQREYGDIQRELLAVLSTDTFAFIAGVVCAESAAKTILTHYRNEVSLIKQAIQLDVPRFIEAPDAVNFMKCPVDDVVVWDGFDLLVGEDLAEFPPPCAWEPRTVTTTGSEKETAVAQILSQIRNLTFSQHEVVMTVHEEEWGFEEFRVGQSNLALLLELDRGGVGDQLH